MQQELDKIGGSSNNLSLFLSTPSSDIYRAKKTAQKCVEMVYPNRSHVVLAPQDARSIVLGQLPRSQHRIR